MLYIFLSLIIYSSVIMLGTFAARKADTNMVSAVENLISAIVPTLIVLPLLSKKVFVSQKVGLLAAVGAGVLIALFTMTINKAYSINKVAIIAPIVFGGAIFLTAILSYFIFKEKISQLQLVGLAILGLGLAVITYARATGR